MDGASAAVRDLLAWLDIIAFVLLLCRPMKRITGLGGVKGTLAGLAGAALFTAVMLALLRKEIKDALYLHPVLSSALYGSLFVLLVSALVMTLRKRPGLTLDQLDLMDGREFEDACARILLANGFENIQQTKASGDFGVDILAEREGVLYGVQCKRYGSRLDSRPIQEISAGMAYYGCEAGAVMTNSRFTAHARELAEAGGIGLWDRDVLEKWLDKVDKLE